MIKNQEQKFLVYWPLKITMLTIAFVAVMYGMFYLNHHGVSKNLQRALSLQTQASKNKSAESIGKESPANQRRAKVILKRPADQGQ